ncbi:helix-turn-helix transcriptional regulator [Rubrivivax gelatinosus]|uniref:Transcriptional regulator n=1 Tax=Rubrivivax gelatinosus TaxID=28068 RepID=A0ABS1E020_RUBGE|nr:WYL domain-containing protein [Rubrivivax gelatinosus]MBK1715674.1 transcriptional regulator [Rubrivivax gelatinosus]
MSNAERLYKIERLIRQRGHVSFQTLQDELEVSRATLKRDLEYLRSRLGAPIVYDRALNGYRLEENTRGARHELPGLWFDERELYSLLAAHQLLASLDDDGTLARHLQPLLQRVREMIGSSDDASLTERVRIVASARRAVPARHFELVAEALLERRRLHLRYLTRTRGEVGERDVSPQRLVHYRNTWYLDAWCHRAGGLRRFALDAMEQASRLDQPALEVGLERVQAEMDAGYGIYAGGTPQWATIVFAASAAAWVSREAWHPQQQGRWLEDGRYELRLPYTDDTELVMDLMRHGADAEVLAPPALRLKLGARLRAAAAVYGDGST